MAQLTETRVLVSTVETPRGSFFQDLKCWSWSFGCFYGHKISVSKWRRILFCRSRST